MKRFFYIVLTTLALLSCQKTVQSPTISTDKTEFSVGSGGDSINITIRTNQESWGYDLGNSSAWITAAKSANTLKLTIAANAEYEKRSADIKVFAPESGANSASQSIKISQSAKIFTPELSIEAENPVVVEAQEGVLELKVNTNFNTWQCEVSDTWLSATAEANTLKLNVEANSSEEDREATITIYAPNKDLYEIIARQRIVQKGLFVEYELENLSATGTSNSYIITHRGPFKLNAKIKGNNKGCEGLDAPTALNPAGAKLVWQSTKEMITKVEYKDGELFFEAGKVPGNAVLAVTNESGEIIWSWHIWRPEIEIVGLNSQTGAKVMNVNLGALNDDPTSLKCYGLLYQWGRKDPLPGSPIRENGNTNTKNVNVYDINGEIFQIGQTSMMHSDNNNLAFSISHPHYCISNNAQQQTSACRDWLKPSESNPSLWGNPYGADRENGEYKTKGTKTYFDPCPLGWRTPDVGVMHHLTSSGSIAWAVGYTDGEMHFEDLGGEAEVLIEDRNKDGMINLFDYDCGWSFYLDKNRSVSSHFPATTRYDGNYALLMGSMVGLWGNYWMNAPTTSISTNNTYLSSALSFGIKTYTGKDEITVSPLASASRADAYAVRCIKED